MSVNLLQDEINLRDQIQNLISKVRKEFDSFNYNDANIETWINEAGTLSHQLHMSLSNRGIEPKHHSYMIENRELPTNDPEFYNHVHPIEDLLKFLDDEHANDDPIDQTIGAEFSFAVYSNRWGHTDNYTITRTEDGWSFQFQNRKKACDKSGRPFLFDLLKHDSIQYPARLEGWMDWLWEKAASDGLTHAQVQSGLKDLADWITITEQNSPSGDIWNGF